ncbi:MAG: hypothetical protein FWE47_02785, partial [Oscillospiraceae bacterium]|nr:hypothetical protein [Oscillospiraceae bacterium]
MKKNPTERRYLTILLIIAAVFIALAFRLVQLQIVNGAAYLQTSITRTTATLPIKAPRGEIFDRYGRPIVTNRMGFSVVMQREKMTNTELNAQIFAMIEVVGKSGDSYIDTLAISKTTPFEFTGSDDEIAALQKMYKKEGMSADELLEHIINRYDIAASDKEQERLIAGVRYEMANRAFGNSNPFTFAQDVSKETVAIFEEQNQYYRGVRIIDEPIREYINPNLAAHIIGRVGIIYAEEYAEKRNLGYSMTDMVGKDGIEKYLEASLKGNDGVSAISEVLVPAQMGSFGVLTLDSHLQKTLEDSLRNNIIGMRSKKDAGGA